MYSIPLQPHLSACFWSPVYARPRTAYLIGQMTDHPVEAPRLRSEISGPPVSMRGAIYRKHWL